MPSKNQSWTPNTRIRLLSEYLKMTQYQDQADLWIFKKNSHVIPRLVCSKVDTIPTLLITLKHKKSRDHWSSWAHKIYSQKCEVKLYQLYSTHYKAKINHAANKCMIHDHIMVLHILISDNNNKKHKTKEWSVVWFRVYCKLVHQRKTCCSSRSCMWCSSGRRAMAQIITCAE